MYQYYWYLIGNTKQNDKKFIKMTDITRFCLNYILRWSYIIFRLITRAREVTWSLITFRDYTELSANISLSKF